MEKTSPNLARRDLLALGLCLMDEMTPRKPMSWRDFAGIGFCMPPEMIRYLGVPVRKGMPHSDQMIEFRNIVRRSDLTTPEIIKALLRSSDFFFNDTHIDLDTPFLTAASLQSCLNILPLLLDHGADITTTDDAGYTALMFAVMFSCNKNAYFLIHSPKITKDYINAQNCDGQTALMLAAIYNNAALTKELIAAGADVNIRDSSGNTALMHAIMKSTTQGYEILTSLISADCDVNCQNDDGDTALMLAAAKSTKPTLIALLDAGSDINAINKKDNSTTALVCLLKNRYLKKILIPCIEYFMDRGANLSILGPAILVKIIFKHHRLTRFIPKLIQNGLVPADALETIEEYISEVRFPVSPLCTAILAGNMQLVDFFMGNNFLTSSDISWPSSKKEVIKNLLELHKYNDMINFIDKFWSQPMPLSKLTFIAVLSALGSNPGHQSRVEQFLCPPRLKDRLLFKTLEKPLDLPPESPSFCSTFSYDHSSTPVSSLMEYLRRLPLEEGDF